MDTYQITDLEQLSGIKAHTIRIWEKRYGLIEPHRTKTNIRYYDNEQVRKLLNVVTLLNAGHKISKLSEMKDEELNELIALSSNSEETDSFCSGAINTLIGATLNYDEFSFEKTYSSVLNRLGLYNAILKVIYPLLYRIGILWTIGDAMPAQEHFTSGLIRRKLMAAIDGVVVNERSRKKAVVFLPPDEWHDIGLLFTDYILRSNGYHVYNLGQNVPYENASVVLNSTGASTAFTFFISRKSQEEIYHSINLLLDKNRDLNLLIAASEQNRPHLPDHKRIQLMNQPEDLLNFIK
ncbi:MAG TPA: MerR family transcriptional regulator [Bacteroidia bacterium]|jgi:DNA-binding transcriptional MerR regulator|nr:MerR family transcriptional regulator [Bacteroidia bacterium]